MKGSDDKLVEIMLEFVRASVLDRVPVIPHGIVVDWDKLMDLSAKQGLLAWVWDGICKLPTEQQPPRQQRINWGLSTQKIWDDYEYQKTVLKELVEVCRKNNMRLLLLKGMGLSMMYPNPASRPSGDIDIYLFGDFEKGNTVLANNVFVFTNKHAEFNYKGVKIENHQNFFYHGTKLQIDVDNYILSTISDCIENKDGYYVLSPLACLVHLLLHTMVHLNNPVEHISIKNVLDVVCYLLFNRKELDPGLCGSTMRQLNLEKAFDLYLQISEWILSVDMSQYRNELMSKSDDAERLITLLLDDTLRCPQFDNRSFLKQLSQRCSYYYHTMWRYAYLPNWRILNHGFVKRQISYCIKSIVGMPLDKSFIYPKSRINLGNKTVKGDKNTFLIE